MTSITCASPRYLQELAAILGPQNSGKLCPILRQLQRSYKSIEWHLCFDLGIAYETVVSHSIYFPKKSSSGLRSLSNIGDMSDLREHHHHVVAGGQRQEAGLPSIAVTDPLPARVLSRTVGLTIVVNVNVNVNVNVIKYAF